MRGIIEDTIQKCVSKQGILKMKDIRKKFLEYDINHSRVLTPNEIREAVKSIIDDELKKIKNRDKLPALPPKKPPSKPGAPKVQGVRAGDGNVRISIKASDDDGGSPVIKYCAVSFPGGHKGCTNSSDVPIVVRSLKNKSPYKFRVTATNALGLESEPSELSTPQVTPMQGLSKDSPPRYPTSPSPPIILNTFAGDRSLYVRYQNPAKDGGSPIVLCRASTDPGGFTGESTTPYNPIKIPSLTNGVAYRTYVKCKNAGGDWSERSKPFDPVTPRMPPLKLYGAGMDFLRNCSYNFIPQMQRAIDRRVDTGGQEGIEQSEFEADPYAFRIIVRAVMERCQRDTKSKQEQDFKAADGDGDGKVSAKELRKQIAKIVRQHLSKKELPARPSGADAAQVNALVKNAIAGAAQALSGNKKLGQNGYLARVKAMQTLALGIARKANSELKNDARTSLEEAAKAQKRLEHDAKVQAGNEEFEKASDRRQAKDEQENKRKAEKRLKERRMKQHLKKKPTPRQMPGQGTVDAEMSVAERMARMQMQLLRREFRHFDADHSGSLNHTEMRHSLTWHTFQYMPELRGKKRLDVDGLMTDDFNVDLVPKGERGKRWDWGIPPNRVESEAEREDRLNEARSCVFQGVRSLTPAVMEDMEENGESSVQMGEYMGPLHMKVIHQLTRELAYRCRFLVRDHIDETWEHYLHIAQEVRSNATGLDVHAVREILEDMLQYSIPFYKKKYDAARRCIEPKVPLLAAHVVLLLTNESHGLITRDDYLEKPFELLWEGEEVARKCQEYLTHKHVELHVPNYDDSFARLVWAQYAADAGTLKSGMSLAQFTRMMQHLLRLPGAGVGTSGGVEGGEGDENDGDALRTCIQGLTTRVAEDLFQRMDRNHDQTLQWPEFRRRDHTLYNTVEGIVGHCEGRDAGTEHAGEGEGEGDAGGTAVERFREVLRGRRVLRRLDHWGRLGRWHTAFVPSYLASTDIDLFDTQRPQVRPRTAHETESITTSLLEVSAATGVMTTAEHKATMLARSHLGVEVSAQQFGVPNVDMPLTSGMMGDRLSIAIVDSGQETLLHALHMSLADNLKHNVNRTATRKLTRSLTKTLTVKMTDSLVGLILKKISDPYVEMATRILNHGLTPALTQSISATVTRAMSRHPVDDYFCYFCLKHEVYCQFCQDSATNDHDMDYYTNAYASFYGDYYRKFYAEEVDVSVIMKPSHPFVDKSEEDTGEPELPAAMEAAGLEPPAPAGGSTAISDDPMGAKQSAS